MVVESSRGITYPGKTLRCGVFHMAPGGPV
jgi:hypothetical protein